MKLSFILPCPLCQPTGGFKIVYEYANRLAERGHSVTVIHPLSISERNLSTAQSLRGGVNFLRHTLMGAVKPPWRWFTMRPGVMMKITPDLRQRWIPDADAVVATLWNTAERISTYGNRKGKKFYFIQGLDTVFNQTIPSRVMDTWKLPFHKIVVSQWLEQIARNRGEECTYIPNGINFSEFNIDMPIEKRDPKTLCIVHKEDTFKGTADGLKALKMVKEKVPDISVIMFGVGPQPPLPSLPITYYLNPSPPRTRNLFNKASIFIGTSWCEGFGLPPCEAAACGAALCVADNGGHREFAVHGNTALVHPPRQPGVLAENILCLLNDNEKRIKIARAGNSYVKRFSWKWSTEEFERTIQKRIAP